MTNPRDSHIIEIEWEVTGLPRLIGPFDTINEAERWGRLNIPNGTWEIRPLAWPYLVREASR